MSSSQTKNFMSPHDNFSNTIAVLLPYPNSSHPHWLVCFLACSCSPYLIVEDDDDGEEEEICWQRAKVAKKTFRQWKKKAEKMVANCTQCRWASGCSGDSTSHCASTTTILTSITKYTSSSEREPIEEKLLHECVNEDAQLINTEGDRQLTGWLRRWHFSHISRALAVVISPWQPVLLATGLSPNVTVILTRR